MPLTQTVQTQEQWYAVACHLLLGVGRRLVAWLLVASFVADLRCEIVFGRSDTIAVAEVEISADLFPMRAVRSALNRLLFAWRFPMSKQVVEGRPIFTGLAG
ncbi:MAG TPA: hypothetical protein VGV39_28685 [Mesorhizobium sp.]|uniref:hypothetical protein n=1 Tax=Mesorhizobium sp. TaxID=1871066 RepID=UPI002DDD6A4F|nr:hypothetical protein [Mesorhizobium sp.]HEV2507082.1 hypothetical protein [Mesorhizobium sp.]